MRLLTPQPIWEHPVRTVVNWLMKAALLLGFDYIGWLTLEPTAESTDIRTKLAGAALIAALFMIARWALTFLSCGLIWIVFPALGWIILTLLVHYVPEHLTLSPSWLYVGAAGFVILFAHFGASESE